MALRVYSTATREKQEFVPNEKGRVKMYVCGPNLYGPAHVGHALSYIVFDVFKRYLTFRGYSVRHVQNFTDIEDRIISTAQAQGTTIEALAEAYIDRFLREMDALNLLRADAYPRATGVIPQIIEITQGLIDKGHAYSVDGDVYFRVRSDEDYGKLSKRPLDEMEAGARVEVDPRKEDPMDFALWKSSKPGEPNWESPWGRGRPGWHIECSAMNLAYLGEQIDVHGGGQDVIFPHHENEIAQSEAFTGKEPFAKYWMHNALLKLSSSDSEKMTRHLGNMVTVEEALELYTPDAIRLFMLSTHYRQPLTWTPEGVEASERGLERLRSAVEAAQAVPDTEASTDGQLAQIVNQTKEEFIEAMDDDLGTPAAIAAIFDLAREINRAKAEGESPTAIVRAQNALRELTGVLGLTLKEPEHVIGEDETGKIEGLIKERADLRASRKFAEADDIRKQLAEMGIVLEDTAQGTVWKKIK